MRALLVDLAPTGFEERATDGGLELAVYADERSLGRIRDALPGAAVATVAAGWEDAWRAFHRPVLAGGVWIGPPWEVPPADRPAVVIDPGLAFGTGAHPTTRLCLELLSGVERGSLLDVGCGSGVLAIAAARLGFGPIVAVDADPVAVEVAAANADVNDVVVALSCRDALSAELPRVDVAVANVLLAPVESILGRLDAATAITSGYVVGERPVHGGWEHAVTAELEGWAADVFRR